MLGIDVTLWSASSVILLHMFVSRSVVPGEPCLGKYDCIRSVVDGSYKVFPAFLIPFFEGCFAICLSPVLL